MMIITGFLWGIGIILATAFFQFVVMPILRSPALAGFVQEVKDDLKYREDVDNGRIIDIPEAEYAVVDDEIEIVDVPERG